MAIARKPWLIPAPWLIVITLLSTLPVLRLGDVQAVEMSQVLCLGAAVPFFLYGGLRIPAGGLWRRYGSQYALFFGLAAVLSLLALRLPFHPPPDISWLKEPGILSASRILEWGLVSFFMLAIAETLRHRPRLLRVAADTYTLAATASACCSILAWALLEAADIHTLLLDGAGPRVRGFFNEGGPYGMFLASAVLVALLRVRVDRPVYPFVHKAAVLILIAALLLSQSKAGLLALIGLGGMAALLSAGGVRKLAVAFVVLLLSLAFLAGFRGSLSGYLNAYLNMEEAAFYRPEDRNLVMGRIAAALIVPRMISAHPVFGVGVGNYSLMRNDPEYLQGLPPAFEWDLAGMGLVGSAAELGIPLTVFLIALLVQPLFRARRRRAPLIVILTAAFQPLAFLLGVNLNFFYPWFVASLALAVEPTGVRGKP